MWLLNRKSQPSSGFQDGMFLSLPKYSMRVIALTLPRAPLRPCLSSLGASRDHINDGLAKYRVSRNSVEYQTDQECSTRNVERGKTEEAVHHPPVRRGKSLARYRGVLWPDNFCKSWLMASWTPLLTASLAPALNVSLGDHAPGMQSFEMTISVLCWKN